MGRSPNARTTRFAAAFGKSVQRESQPSARLGLHSAFVGLGTLLLAARGTSGGHGRTAAGRRVVAHVARRLLAGEELPDLVARQRLVFEQALGDGDPFLL